MKEYFTIGDMAIYSGLSAKKLRYYDEIGILSPKHKDPKSGYRYYSFSEFEKSILLKTMRDQNFSLERIKKEFATMTAERYLELLKIRNEEIEVRIQRLQQMKRFLGARINELGVVTAMPMDRCFIVPLPSFKGVIYPIKNQSREGMRQLVKEIEKEQNDGANILLILRMVLKETIEAGRPNDYSYLFVILADFTGYEDRIVTLPDQQYAVCHCPEPKLKSLKCWQKLLAFIKESNYEICGDGIKKIVIDQGLIAGDSDYIAMLGIPVRKKDTEQQ